MSCTHVRAKECLTGRFCNSYLKKVPIWILLIDSCFCLQLFHHERPQSSEWSRIPFRFCLSSDEAPFKPDVKGGWVPVRVPDIVKPVKCTSQTIKLFYFIFAIPARTEEKHENTKTHTRWQKKFTAAQSSCPGQGGELSRLTLIRPRPWTHG